MTVGLVVYIVISPHVLVTIVETQGVGLGNLPIRTNGVAHFVKRPGIVGLGTHEGIYLASGDVVFQ